MSTEMEHENRYLLNHVNQEIYRDSDSKWRVDRRFDPLPLPLPMLHLNFRQHSTTDRNTTLAVGGGGKRALVFQLM